MRIQPKWYVGVAVLVAYMAIVAVSWALLGVDYPTVQDSAGNILRGVVVPIGIGAIFLAGVTTWLGWWRPAMREEPVVAPRWLLAAPIVIGLAALGSAVSVDFTRVSLGYVAMLALGVALVGFSEELVCRGLLVVGLRGSVSELWVWLVSSLLFGLLHAINALFGQSVAATVPQIVFAFLVGTVLYVVRMTTGLLVVAMVIHALWDFGSLGSVGSGTAGFLLAMPLLLLGILVSLIGVGFVIPAKNRLVDQPEVAATVSD